MLSNANVSKRFIICQGEKALKFMKITLNRVFKIIWQKNLVRSAQNALLSTFYYANLGFEMKCFGACFVRIVWGPNIHTPGLSRRECWRWNNMANKAELVNDVASATGLTKKDATAAVDAVFSSIQASLAKGDKVQLIGFGNFEVRQRAARKGRNPQTGQEIQIPASKVPAFKPGKALKDAVK